MQSSGFRAVFGVICNIGVARSVRVLGFRVGGVHIIGLVVSNLFGLADLGHHKDLKSRTPNLGPYATKGYVTGTPLI